MSSNEAQTPEQDDILEETDPVAEPIEAGEAEVIPDETPEENEADVLRAELAAEKDKYLRLLAEYDNFRKRSAREKDNLYGDIRANTITALLPVYDNLERALAQETTDEAYRKGVEMTMNQLKDIMEKLGVSPIDAVGKTFDPAFHNAVMHVDDPEKGENEITMEFQKGFTLGDRVIRFSMVQVAN